MLRPLQHSAFHLHVLAARNGVIDVRFCSQVDVATTTVDVTAQPAAEARGRCAGHCAGP